MKRVIKKVELLCNPVGFMEKIPDIDLIAEKFPNMMSDDKAGIFELLERQAGDNLISCLKNYDVFRIKFNDGSDFLLRYKDIAKWFPHYVDFYRVVTFKNFLLLILSPANGQAGSLGIWNAESLSWDFDYFDEFFCVESVAIIPEINTLIGNTSYQLPLHDRQGRDLFIIRDKKISIFAASSIENIIKSKLEYIYTVEDTNQIKIEKYFDSYLITISGPNFQENYLVPESQKLFS